MLTTKVYKTNMTNKTQSGKNKVKIITEILSTVRHYSTKLNNCIYKEEIIEELRKWKIKKIKNKV